jgi:hypothetical protein
MEYILRRAVSKGFTSCPNAIRRVSDKTIEHLVWQGFHIRDAIAVKK